jgi:murein DD-endopeptidase MepM/ murein hydrolase activator NlpD
VKIIIMHARRGTQGYFTLEGVRMAVLMSATLLLAGVLGAYMYRGFFKPAVPVAPAALPLDAGQAQRDSILVRGNLTLLAGRLGALQARMFGLEAFSRRIAAAAGLGEDATPLGGAVPGADAAMPPLQHHGEDWNEASATQSALHPESAQALGQRLDALFARVAVRMAALDLLDVALTGRGARLERLPTAPPVADYPYLSSSYGWRRHPVTGRDAMHHGLDFAAPADAPILAAAGGMVREARQEPGYGKLVEIDHGDGYITRYAHASRLLVKQGEPVVRGQVLARVGSSGLSTGPHLHFEVRLAGQALDPRLFVARQATAPPTPTTARAALD